MQAFFTVRFHLKGSEDKFPDACGCGEMVTPQCVCSSKEGRCLHALGASFGDSSTELHQVVQVTEDTTRQQH